MRLKFVFSVKRLKYYSTIDELPLRNWIKIHDGDLSYMRRNLTIGNDKNDAEYYNILYSAYIEEMGLDKIYLKSLNLMKKIALLQCDYIISGDRVKLTKAEMQMSRLKSMLAKNSNNDKISIQESLVHLSKWIGSYIDIDKITARKYLDMLRALEAENKKVKETRSNGKENHTK